MHAAAAAGARFRLLALALKYCRRCLAPAPAASPAAGARAARALALQRELLAAGLGWFAQPPAYFAACTHSQAEEACQALADFLKHLEAVGAEWRDALEAAAPGGFSSGGGAVRPLSRARRPLLLSPPALPQ